LKYQLAIFDVDGTLADSFPWFAKVLNGVAEEFGFRGVDADEVEALRGCDAREILRRLDVPRWKLPMIARRDRRDKLPHPRRGFWMPALPPAVRALPRVPIKGNMLPKTPALQFERIIHRDRAAGCGLRAHPCLL